MFVWKDSQLIPTMFLALHSTLLIFMFFLQSKARWHSLYLLPMISTLTSDMFITVKSTLISFMFFRRYSPILLHMVLCATVL